MARKTYTIGSLGGGGAVVNGAGGELFEPYYGEYTNFRTVRRDAAELALAWARDNSSGECELSIISDDGDGLPWVVATLSATHSGRRVRWD